MEKNDLKELSKIFEPMNKYYSLLLIEKEAEIDKKEKLQVEWNEYSLLVKTKIKQYRQEIIVALKEKTSEFSSSNYFFDDAWDFLKRNQYVPFKEDEGINFWGWINGDFKMLDFLDKMVSETNAFIQLEKKEKLNSFIEKYFLIAQKELDQEKYFVIDNTWLTAKAHSSGDIIPQNSTSQIVNIIKAKLRVPKRKIRKKIEPALRKSIGDRDGWKCKHCGADLSLKTSSFEVNHIDCNPSNNDPLNLELTCRVCNKKYKGLV